MQSRQRVAQDAVEASIARQQAWGSIPTGSTRYPPPVGSDAIFLIKDGSLVRLEASDYESEDLLQRLLADFPDLLAGGQIDSASPRRWMLIAREVGVPGDETGPNRWSLDHLFVDQDGVPTLVEVKRSTDTRIRREVVGQMLDYAANGIRYWPSDELRAAFETTHADHRLGPEGALGDLLGPDADADEFWSRVDENLHSGRIRMVFVADQIPTELQTIVEFLNEEMEHTDVLGVEIKQYAGQGLQTLVPRVIGMTAAAKHKGNRRTGSFDEYLKVASEASRQIADRLLALDGLDGLDVSQTRTGLRVRESDGRSLMLLYPQWDYVEFYLGDIWDAGLDSRASVLLASLTEIADRRLTERHPIVPCTRLLEAWERFVDEILPAYRSAHQRSVDS
jgi:hypothetical protein